jgi:hypothetical protein
MFYVILILKSQKEKNEIGAITPFGGGEENGGLMGNWSLTLRIQTPAPWSMTSGVVRKRKKTC